MTIDSYLRSSSKLLQTSNVLTYRLDALVLLSYVTGLSKAHILAQPEYELSEIQLKVLNNLFNRRSKHVPVAQLTNSCEFYGRKFIINEHVMQPRPESEAMIESLKLTIASDRSLSSMLNNNTRLDNDSTIKMLSIADIGCGSGALGITAYLELKNCHVDLLEIDLLAIKVAESNVAFHTIDLSVIQSNLLSNTSTYYEIILANLPYVPDTMKLNLSAEFEPKISIFGGPDGLDIYRQLFKSLYAIQHKPLYIITESFPSDHTTLKIIAQASGYTLQQTNDFIQVFKITSID
jgi:release factor glutamine methyltransferase